MSSKPVFKKILQIGIVVKDLEKAVRTYCDVYGIGPWKYYTLDKSNMRDTKLRGKNAEISMKVALADLEGLQLELIEPLNESIYAEFLREHGNGIHHLACAVDNFDETVAFVQERGAEVLMEGTTSSGMGYAYLDTREALSCITEIYNIPARLKNPSPDSNNP